MSFSQDSFIVIRVTLFLPKLTTSTAADAAHLAKSAILTTTNDIVDRINAHATDIFPGDAHEYLSADSISSTDSDHQDLPVDYLNTLSPNGTVLLFTSFTYNTSLTFAQSLQACQPINCC